MTNQLKQKLKKNEKMIKAFKKIKYYQYKYFLSDEKVIKKEFKKRLNRDVELKNPEMFNDKLQWLKLHWYNPLAIKCADKYEVRQYIKELIGEKYLNNLLGIYETVEEIDINVLPKSFVLKGTHGSGFNVICKDKDEMDWNLEFKKMNKWFKTNYFWLNREWVYKDIKPRIICEEFIEQENDEELRDYRFFCFNGEPKFISVDFSITDKKKTRRNLYDLKWKLLEGEISYPKELSFKLEKPKKINEMIELSKKISSGFPHARIDFYYIKDEIKFGEVTFFHQSGMGIIKPLAFEKELGSYITLPKTN